MRKIAGISKVRKSTVAIRKTHLEKNDLETLKAMTDSDRGITGRETTLTPNEVKRIVHRLLFTASRGAASNYVEVKNMMARVASDGQKGFKNGVPSKDFILSFRASYRELPFRSAECKESAKLIGENYDHVKGFSNILGQLKQQTPTLFDSPSRI